MSVSKSVGFHWDDPGRQWSFLADCPHRFGLERITCSLEINGETKRLAQADEIALTEFKAERGFNVDATFSEGNVRWILNFEICDDGQSVLIRSQLENKSERTITLGRCNLIEVEEAQPSRLHIGPEPERATFFVFQDNLWSHYFKRLAADGGSHQSKILAHLHNSRIGQTLFAAFVTFDRAYTRHVIECHPQNGPVQFASCCDFNGYALAPGAAIDSETLMVSITADPYQPLDRWADRVSANYRPPIPEKAPVGWVGWAWVDGIFVERHDEVVERNATAIRQRLPGFDIEYVWISITNLKEGRPGNWLRFNEKLFPHGVEKTLARLQELGFKPGFWMAPYYMVEGAEPDMKENAGNLMRNARGELTDDGGWAFSTIGQNMEAPRIRRLDPSHPNTVRYLKRIFSAYREMGIRYYMIDFLRVGMPTADDDYHDRSMLRGMEVYRNGLKAVREAAGDDTHLQASSSPTIGNTGLVNAQRIGSDFGEGRFLKPLFRQYPATYSVEQKGMLRNAIQNMAVHYFAHRKFFLNDSNILTVDKPLSREEAILSATIFGIGGSPIMLGDEMAQIDEERLAIIKKLLPRPQGGPIPVDLFDRVYPEDMPRVFVTPVRTQWSEWHIVAVFNLDDTPFQVELSASKLLLAPDTDYWVYDFWSERYCRVQRNQFFFHVPPFSCRLLKIEKTRPHPWVLSTDMHVRQGELDLEDVEWDSGRRVLRGVALRPEGQSGNLVLTAPHGYKLSDYRNLWVAKDNHTDELIIRKPIVFEKERMPWQVGFEELTAEELAAAENIKKRYPY